MTRQKFIPILLIFELSSWFEFIKMCTKFQVDWLNLKRVIVPPDGQTDGQTERVHKPWIGLKGIGWMSCRIWSGTKGFISLGISIFYQPSQHQRWETMKKNWLSWTLRGKGRKGKRIIFMTKICETVGRMEKQERETASVFFLSCRINQPELEQDNDDFIK
jgi:hypothetical protein